MAEASALDGRGPNEGARLTVLADRGLRRSSLSICNLTQSDLTPIPYVEVLPDGLRS